MHLSGLQDQLHAALLPHIAPRLAAQLAPYSRAATDGQTCAFGPAHVAARTTTRVVVASLDGESTFEAQPIPGSDALRVRVGATWQTMTAQDAALPEGSGPSAECHPSYDPVADIPRLITLRGLWTVKNIKSVVCDDEYATYTCTMQGRTAVLDFAFEDDTPSLSFQGRSLDTFYDVHDLLTS